MTANKNPPNERDRKRGGLRVGERDGNPFSETAPESARDVATGRVLAGNQLARRHPKPPATDDLAVRARLAARTDQIVGDLGGADRVGAVRRAAVERFALLELFAEAWETHFLQSGLMTRQGRVRSGYAAGYLTTVGQLHRLAQTIGLDRVVRQVPQTPMEWLQGQPDDTETHAIGGTT